MTLVESTGGNGSKALIVGVIIVLILLAGAFFAIKAIAAVLKPSVECKVPANLNVKYDRPAELEKLQGTYWACNGLVCNRLMTPQEWVNKYCITENAATNCRIKAPDGNIYSVPVNQINMTAIKECAEYLCLQEVMVRNATYIIPAP
jgi:hypothetical protein